MQKLLASLFNRGVSESLSWTQMTTEYYLFASLFNSLTWGLRTLQSLSLSQALGEALDPALLDGAGVVSALMSLDSKKNQPVTTVTWGSFQWRLPEVVSPFLLQLPSWSTFLFCLLMFHFWFVYFMYFLFHFQDVSYYVHNQCAILYQWHYFYVLPVYCPPSMDD